MSSAFDQCYTRRNDTYFQLQRLKAQSSFDNRVISCCLPGYGLSAVVCWQFSLDPSRKRYFVVCSFVLCTNALLSYRSHLGGNQTLDHVIWSDLGPPPPPSTTRTTQFTLGIYKQYIIVIEGVSQRKRQFLLHEKRSSPKLYFYV